jgi:hypothetical protein
MAPKKTSYWYRYVDDMFVIWPRGMEELQKFQHLNNIHTKIKFTMEIETDGLLLFLDTLVTEKPVGSLVHSVYRKLTHTDLCLHEKSHHHPLQNM